MFPHLILSQQQNQNKDGAAAAAAGENPDDYDGKKPRKSMMRKTVDYNSAFMAMLEARVWQRDQRYKMTRV